MSASGTHQSYRILWAQVVLQAKADVEQQPIDSVLYDQAAAFFVSGGSWAESRGIVADVLDMHPDDLVRQGQHWIAERRRQEGAATPRKPARRGRARSEAPAGQAGAQHQPPFMMEGSS